MPDVSVVTADNLGADFDVGVVETGKVNIKRAGATTYGLIRLSDITSPSGVFSLLATSTVVGSTINSTTIGASSPSTGAFTSLTGSTIRSGTSLSAIASETMSASKSDAGNTPGIFAVYNSGTTVGTGAAINFATNTNATALVSLASIAAKSTDTAGSGDLVFTTVNAAVASEKARITAAGQVLLGTDVSRNVSGVPHPLQIETAGTSASMSLVRNSADANGPSIAFGKSAGATVGSVNAVAQDDALGQVTWAGADGTNMSFNPSSQIQALVDGAVAPGSIPSRLTFWTTNTAATTAIEQMRITGAGNVGIGETVPTQKLHVNGNIQQNNGQYIRGKTAAGTSTRIVGVNASDVMYVGSVDAPISSILFSNNGLSMATLTSNGFGIGMTPSYSVDVTKNINSTSAIRVINTDAGTVADSRLILSNGTNIAASIILRGATNATDPNSLNISSGGAYDLHLFAGGAKRVTLDAAGPVRVLSAVSSTSTTTGALIVTGGAGISGALYNGGLISTIQASSGSTVESLRLANSGTGANTKSRLNFYAASSNYASISGGFGATSPEMTFSIEGASPGLFSWATTPGVESMRLNTVGNLGVGTIAPLTRFDSATNYTAGTVTDAALFCQSSGANPTIGQGVRIYLSANASTSRAAAIESVVSSGINGHHLAFLTNLNGAVPTERLRINSAGDILNTSSGGLGFGTGSGGAVTQLTSKATGVTLNKSNGAVTMHAASLAAATSVSFVLTSSSIAATDCVNVCLKSGGTLGAYHLSVDAVAAGSCTISLRNLTAGALAEAVVITYIVVKAAIA